MKVKDLKKNDLRYIITNICDVIKRPDACVGPDMQLLIIQDILVEFGLMGNNKRR